MISLDFPTIAERLDALELPHVDLVVGIATGGIAPATLIAYKQRTDLLILQFNYRDEQNKPRFEHPVRQSEISIPDGVRSILLVDDVSVSGKTLDAARAFLKEYDITTLVMKGKADYVVLPEIGDCVDWPWKIKRG
jgi:hypoxanthine phosphoribosyltransferase